MKKDNTNQQRIYAFIDAQNLYSGVNKSFSYWAGRGKRKNYEGWKLDMKTFYSYLSKRFGVTKAILFMGNDPKYKSMRNDFRSFGYDIILKPYIADNHGKTKGNCDAELVLHACKIEYPNYDKAIVVSGDGDFYCLIKDMIEENKLHRLLIPNEHRYSQLYKPYIVEHGVFVSRLSDILSA